jgi:hypothetical protein
VSDGSRSVAYADPTENLDKESNASSNRQQTRISLSGIGRPTENGFGQRLMRTLKEEEGY